MLDGPRDARVVPKPLAQRMQGFSIFDSRLLYHLLRCCVVFGAIMFGTHSVDCVPVGLVHHLFQALSRFIADVQSVLG